MLPLLQQPIILLVIIIMIVDIITIAAANIIALTTILFIIFAIMAVQLHYRLLRRQICREALDAYQEALSFAPGNKIAMQRSDFCKTRLENRGIL